MAWPVPFRLSLGIGRGREERACPRLRFRRLRVSANFLDISGAPRGLCLSFFPFFVFYRISSRYATSASAAAAATIHRHHLVKRTRHGSTFPSRRGGVKRGRKRVVRCVDELRAYVTRLVVPIDGPHLPMRLIAVRPAKTREYIKCRPVYAARAIIIISLNCAPSQPWTKNTRIRRVLFYFILYFLPFVLSPFSDLCLGSCAIGSNWSKPRP